MKRLVVSLALASLCSWALAQTPSDASISRLLELTEAEKTVSNLHANLEQFIRRNMQQAAAGKPLTAEQQKVIELAPARLVAVMREELNWTALKPQYVAIYQESFTQPEIDGLITFYQSPAGRAFTAKMPVVMQKSMAMSQSMMQRAVPKLQQAMAETLREAGIQPK